MAAWRGEGGQWLLAVAEAVRRADVVMLAAPDPGQPVQVEAVTCSSCRRVHLVDVKTGKLLLQPVPAEPVVRFSVQ